MKLDYGTLLSSDPLQMPYGFSIISPTLSEISKLGFNSYNYYLSTLNLDIESYYKTVLNSDIDYFGGFSVEEKDLIQQVKNEYDSIPDSEKASITPIVIFSYDKILMESISKSLSFFTNVDFKYSKDDNAFVSSKEDAAAATIELKYFEEVADMIFQRNGINKPQKEDKPKFKNKIAEKLYYRTLEAENKNKRNNDLELPNIISSVSAMHNSLNIINIWEITIYQLYDQFQRLQNNCVYDIQAFSVGAWGDKDNKFDQTMWYKNLNTRS